MLHHFRPRWARHTNRRDQVRFILIGLALIYDGAVAALSLGYLTSDVRSWLLFDLFED